MTMRMLAAAVAVAAIALPGSVSADTAAPTAIAAPKGAPFKITACSARAHAGDESTKQLWDLAAQVRNAGRKPIEALEVRFELHRLLPTSEENEYGAHPNTSAKYEPDHALAPGESASVRSEGMSWFERMKLKHAVCIPFRAVFSDGTSWKNAAYADID